jgi:5-formyltetrahydrofolate cyclo-ligase
MKTKAEIRQEMRAKRIEVSQETRLEAGQEIAKKLVESEVRLLLKAWKVALYLSVTHEIPTRYIVRSIWEAGREIVVPYWSATQKSYQLTLMKPAANLIKGKMGIREPQERIPVSPVEVDAFILPGLAFDLQGGRLGYGAGIYDTILSQARKNTPKIAICYDWQILEDPLPLESHDVRMDWIVTEKRVINCKKNNGL